MALSPKSKKQLLKFLLPLVGFGAVLLAVLGYFQHQRMMERTRINFTIETPDDNPMFSATVLLDGKAAMKGQRISLGSHTLKVTHPHGETFETNFSAWYGGKDLGVIALKRSTGTLSIHSKRPILILNIGGRDFNAVLTNVTEKAITVPTDDYTVMAWFPNRPADTQKISVAAGQVGECTFSPAYGTLHATANRDDVTYELTDGNGQTVKKGKLPFTNDELPVGTYRLATAWRSHTAEKQIAVKKDETSEAAMDFTFGAAVLRTTPAGATVYGENGAQLGNTPLLVAEVPPGPVEYRLRLDGYDAVSVAFTISANVTNEVSTNLMSLAYLDGMRRARADMTAADYRDAVTSLESALKAKPGDANATALLRQAKCSAAVQEAKDLAARNEYAAAGQKLQAALDALPDDAEAKALQPGYKTHATEQVAQSKETRTRAVFDQEWQKSPVGSLFDPHEYVTARMSPEEAKNALVKLYVGQWPKAVTTFDRTPEDGVYEVLFDQSPNNPTETAKREMLVVFGKSKDGQTLILFKNFEYQRSDTGLWMPLSQGRIEMTALFNEQIKVGVRMMLRKIKLAIGETDKY